MMKEEFRELLVRGGGTSLWMVLWLREEKEGQGEGEEDSRA